MSDDSERVELAELETLKDRLQDDNVYLQDEIRREHNFEEIVGNSPALLEICYDRSTALLRRTPGAG
jgi:hypothetical protein